jgi:hypothetical protein
MAAALAAALASTSARAEFISCDKFMERLRDAARALTFPLPAVQIERNPAQTDSDAFWVKYNFPPDNEAYEGSLGCSRGHFDDYQIDIDPPGRWRIGRPEALRSVHMVAAAMYAYTGWEPRQAIALANKLIAKQPRNVEGAKAYEEELPNEGGISILPLSILVSGKCDPASYPTLCGPDKPK